ncbi:MAG: VWA domain-containing protein, partial [Phycisphaerales bacterium]|nr:VWA domain-containing protein [Phycisphaerales bacterium]
DVSTHPHQETHDEDDSGGGGSGQPGGHTEDSQTAAEHEESKGDQPDHTAAAAESDRANQPAEQGTLESDPPPSSDASLAPPSHRPRRFDDADLAQVSAPAAGEVLEPWQREARGVWKLLAVHDPENDFLPQGADERYIGIDPDARVLRAVLSWDGIATVSMAAEFEVGFRPEQVEIQPLPQAPSAFPHAPSTLLGGGQFKPAASPPPCELRWSRAGSRLRIGGSEYERAEPDTMIDLLNQPEPTTHGSEGFGEEGDISDPLGSAATVDFFGVQAEGRYFCYVVDVSGSMATNNGMHRLKAELERSLESLPRGTRFAVLPFNHTLRDLQSSWVSASPRRAADIGHRLSRVGAAGGTDPSEAFAWAFRRLNPRPDAIFFMTDGKVNDEPRLVSQLASLNASAPRTRIHTIGLGNDAAMQLLERLAAEHGGTARSVR